MLPAFYRCEAGARACAEQADADGSIDGVRRLDSSRAIRALYASDELLGLVKAITGGVRVTDPLGAASTCFARLAPLALRRIGIYRTLSLVQAAEGGAFEFTVRLAVGRRSKPVPPRRD